MHCFFFLDVNLCALTKERLLQDYDGLTAGGYGLLLFLEKAENKNHVRQTVYIFILPELHMQDEDVWPLEAQQQLWN